MIDQKKKFNHPDQLIYTIYIQMLCGWGGLDLFPPPLEHHV